jgi:hypothetical protein
MASELISDVRPSQGTPCSIACGVRHQSGPDAVRCRRVDTSISHQGRADAEPAFRGSEKAHQGFERMCDGYSGGGGET